MTDAREEERDALLRRLRDLDEEFAAGELDELDYRNLRDDYTARAAAVLRQLEKSSSVDVDDEFVDDDRHDLGDLGDIDDVDDLEESRTRRRPARTRLVAAALVVAVIAGGAGYALAGTAKPRAMADQVSGSLPEGSVDRITRANVLVSEGKILEAVRVYDDLLKDDPENPVALAERGWILSRVDPDLVDSGLASIDRAITIDPQYPEAHFFRGMILWRAKGEPAMAVESFQRAIDAKPPASVIASIESVKSQAQAQADATGTPPASVP